MSFMPGKFTEEEVNKYIDALNFVAQEATFGKEAPKLKYSIEMVKHFTFLQNLVPKIQANIAEVIKKENKKTKSKK